MAPLSSCVQSSQASLLVDSQALQACILEAQVLAHHKVHPQAVQQESHGRVPQYLLQTVWPSQSHQSLCLPVQWSPWCSSPLWCSQDTSTAMQALQGLQVALAQDPQVQDLLLAQVPLAAHPQVPQCQVEVFQVACSYPLQALPPTVCSLENSAPLQALPRHSLGLGPSPPASALSCLESLVAARPRVPSVRDLEQNQ